MWMPKGKRPIVVTTGSHQKTCVFGVLSIDVEDSYSGNMIPLIVIHS